jgi:hypothetical protein
MYKVVVQENFNTHSIQSWSCSKQNLSMIVHRKISRATYISPTKVHCSHSDFFDFFFLKIQDIKSYCTCTMNNSADKILPCYRIYSPSVSDRGSYKCVFRA